MSTIATVYKRSMKGDEVLAIFAEVGSSLENAEQVNSPEAEAINFARENTNDKYHYFILIVDTIAEYHTKNYRPRLLSAVNNYRATFK